MYIACINASRMDSNNASKLLSGNEAEIKSVFDNIKCSTYTRSFLIDLAPELGHMLQQLNDSTFNQEDNDKPNGGYTPFAGLNPADFPEYIDGKQTVDDSSNDKFLKANLLIKQFLNRLCRSNSPLLKLHLLSRL